MKLYKQSYYTALDVLDVLKEYTLDNVYTDTIENLSFYSGVSFSYLRNRLLPILFELGLVVKLKQPNNRVYLLVK